MGSVPLSVTAFAGSGAMWSPHAVAGADADSAAARDGAVSRGAGDGDPWATGVGGLGRAGGLPGSGAGCVAGTISGSEAGSSSSRAWCIALRTAFELSSPTLRYTGTMRPVCTPSASSSSRNS